VSPLLRVERVSRRLADPEPVSLLRDVSLAVDAGEFVAVVGPSGCGKSSLLYLLGLLDRPTTGTVTIDARPTDGLSDAERTRLRLERIGFVFQFHFLLPELTAAPTWPCRCGGWGGARRGRSARGEALLAKLGIAAEAAKRPDRMSAASGSGWRSPGAGQRPGADPRRRAHRQPGQRQLGVVVAEFQRLAHEEGRAVICVTHDMEVAAAADRRVHMLDGRVRARGLGARRRGRRRGGPAADWAISSARRSATRAGGVGLRSKREGLALQPANAPSDTSPTLPVSRIAGSPGRRAWTA
jgi:lipoprotein-releasing system ATP-binding protein